jgi:hypothetical protein
VEEALKHDIHLETSYAYDIEIIKKLYAKKKITKDTLYFAMVSNKSHIPAVLPIC